MGRIATLAVLAFGFIIPMTTPDTAQAANGISFYGPPNIHDGNHEYIPWHTVQRPPTAAQLAQRQKWITENRVKAEQQRESAEAKVAKAKRRFECVIRINDDGSRTVRQINQRPAAKPAAAD